VALVVATPASTDEAAVLKARTELEDRFELSNDAELRSVLERDEEPIRRAQEALAVARQALRRFEMDAARRALSEAQERAGLLTPTADARALVVEVAVREAELARVESRAAEVTRHLGEALSIDPTLSLDRDLYAPPLIAQLAALRTRTEQAPKVSVKIDTVPSGARVLVGGAERCCTPLTVSLSAGWQVLWFHADRYRPAMMQLLLSSSGPVSVPLVAESRAERVRPMVAAVRGAVAGEDRERAAATLRNALGVDAVAVLDRPGEAPVLYERSVEPAAPAAVAVAPPPPTETSTEEGPPAAPGFFARRWPAFAAVLVGAGLVAGGAVLGSQAQADARAADMLHFASDGDAMWQAASGKAWAANGLYIGAAVLAVVAVVLYFAL
jgi:hypothetical protein